MAKHHPDLIFCRKQAGVGDGKCVICDSYVRPCTLVRICDECNYGSYQGRCVICGGPGVSDAYYCKECTIQEKDVSLHNILHFVVFEVSMLEYDSIKCVFTALFSLNRTLFFMWSSALYWQQEIT
uniref:Uncharacterized protein n=1 Tax=Periophthalmus magnuspinnatus TaxID=409849 RepID=A0A3B3ZHV8_9GOBI